MSVRDVWERVARGDRFVYGVALVLLLLALVPLAGRRASGVLGLDRPVGHEDCVLAPEGSPDPEAPGEAGWLFPEARLAPVPALVRPHAHLPSPFEKHGTVALLGASVALVLAWELAKGWEARVRASLAPIADAASGEAPLRLGPLLAILLGVAGPLGLGPACLAAWLAGLVAPRGTSGHPLLEQVLSPPVGAFVTVYVVVGALVLAWASGKREPAVE